MSIPKRMADRTPIRSCPKINLAVLENPIGGTFLSTSPMPVWSVMAHRATLIAIFSVADPANLAA